MKRPSDKLATAFAKSIRADGPAAAPAKSAFLRQLDYDVNELARALPYVVRRGVGDGATRHYHRIPLPAAVDLQKGEVRLGEGALSYKDLRDLSGVRQLIAMAKKADIDIDIELYSGTAFRSLTGAFQPPRATDKDSSYYTLSVILHPGRKFDAAKYPARLPQGENRKVVSFHKPTSFSVSEAKKAVRSVLNKRPS